MQEFEAKLQSLENNLNFTNMQSQVMDMPKVNNNSDSTNNYNTVKS